MVLIGNPLKSKNSWLPTEAYNEINNGRIEKSSYSRVLTNKQRSGEITIKLEIIHGGKKFGEEQDVCISI